MLRGLLAERDAEIAVLRAERDADQEAMRRLGLRLEELERRLRQDSSDSGTPTSKDSIAARERRKAERADPDRGRRKDRRPGGQPGHEGKGLARDPSPGERKKAPPPAECRRCKAGLDGAVPAPGSWAQVTDVLFSVLTTEWELPGRRCPCCGEVTIAAAPPGAHAGSVSYGPALNGAAIVLTAHANVPPEKAAQVIAMLLGVPVSAGWVDKACECRKLCHQAIFMNHASGAVARLDPELIQAGDAVAQREARSYDVTVGPPDPWSIIGSHVPQPSQCTAGVVQGKLARQPYPLRWR
jgi:transposase